MKIINRKSMMSGVAAFAVAVTSCGDKKVDSADNDTSENNAAAGKGMEMVNLNLSGLR